MTPEDVTSLQDLPLAKHHFTQGGHRDSLQDYRDLGELEEVA